MENSFAIKNCRVVEKLLVLEASVAAGDSLTGGLALGVRVLLGSKKSMAAGDPLG